MLHGRRIARALWDYYKVSNIIEESCYVDPRTLTATGTEGADAGLSVMRLKELSRLVILDFKSKPFLNCEYLFGKCTQLIFFYSGKEIYLMNIPKLPRMKIPTLI